MKDVDMLRKIAADLRIEADRRDEARHKTATHIVKAAAGLGLLRLSTRSHA